MEENTIQATLEASDDLSNRFLTFGIDGAIYGISLTNVLEIIGIQDITSVPNVPQHVKGLINLRGKVVPVIDTRLKMGKPERDYDDLTCIVVIDIQDMHIGLIVDKVEEVISVDLEHAAVPPRTGIQEKQFLSSVVEHGNHTVLNIDLEKFMADDLRQY
ncbi:MAG: chemotaxis protein CheW [Oscillospiraceae bacterium]|jgi:purine-binding chemotaxis protein CheW|nr:chemotaxis protein CheW [Oscillospiraceae bacterium]